jgi:hypothetical protein
MGGGAGPSVGWGAAWTWVAVSKRWEIEVAKIKNQRAIRLFG